MIEALLKGITLGLLLSISVGPVMFSIIKQSLNSGYKGGMTFVLGVSASDIALVLISNVFTELFGSLSSHRKEVGIIGSALLIMMGIYFLFFKKIQVNDKGQQIFSTFRRSDYVKTFLAGFFMNMLNPGVILFWLTTSTTMVSHTVEQRLIIFTLCLAIVLSADVAKVVLAEKIRYKLTPKNIHLINRLNGLILIGFGIALVWGLQTYLKSA